MTNQEFQNLTSTAIAVDVGSSLYNDSPQSGLLRVVRQRDGELEKLGNDLVRRSDWREVYWLL